MKIVHCSMTPCAGAIVDLSDAINDYTEHTSRVINNGGKVNNLVFGEDLTWASTQIFPTLARADAVVFHQTLSPQTAPGRDFLDGDPAKKVAAFYHSHPDACNKTAADMGLPVFTVAQYQSLLWENSTPVRNVIRWDRADFPIRDEERAKREDPDKIWIGYGPTFRQSQKDAKPGSSEWYHSKGFDVTMPILNAIDKKHECVEVMIFEGVRYDSMIRGKAQCDIWIDEVVTGSYHRSTLEALALGIPTIVNISPAVHGVITRAAGANDIPIVQATIEDLEEKLDWLVEMKAHQRRKMGNDAQAWMHRHWHPRDIAREFCEKLEECPTYGEVVEAGTA